MSFLVIIWHKPVSFQVNTNQIIQSPDRAMTFFIHRNAEQYVEISSARMVTVPIPKLEIVGPTSSILSNSLQKVIPVDGEEKEPANSSIFLPQVTIPTERSNVCTRI